MAGLGRKVWAAGEVVDNDEVQNYLQDQTILRYGTEAEANSSIGTAVASGMVRYITGTNSYQKYDGTSWSGLSDLSTNYIANGDFSKWSAGTGVVTLPSIQSMADRWFFASGDTYTGSGRQSFTPGSAPVAGYESQYFARYVVTTAGLSSSFSQYGQRFNDARLLAGQTVTFSYWAKADAAKSIAIELVQAFGTGGSTAVTTFVAKQALTTSWTRYSHTFTVPSVSGKTITSDSRFDLRFWLSAGSDYNARTGTLGNQNITFDVWGVQLEEGASVTDFKPSGGLKALDTVATGPTGFDGVLVSTISDPIVGAGTPAWAGYDVAGKNKVINGGFDFWQRGTTFNNPTSGTYTADRFVFGYDGAIINPSFTISRQTFTPGAAPVAGYEGQYYLRYQQNSGTNSGFQSFQQYIEDVRTFAGQTVTLSFWAKSDTTRLMGSELVLRQFFGTGGSSVVSTFLTIPTLTTSWQRFTFTTTLPSIAGKTIGANSYLSVIMGMPLNTVSTVDIWGVQLEAGSVATPFSRAGGTIQGEKSACQRYYWRTTALGTNDAILPVGTAISSTQVIIHGYHPTSMRNFTTSFDFSNLRLWDGVSAFTVTAVASSFTNPDTYALTISCSGGLTQYRPYVVLANTGPSYFGANAEL